MVSLVSLKMKKEKGMLMFVLGALVFLLMLVEQTDELVFTVSIAVGAVVIIGATADEVLRGLGS